MLLLKVSGLVRQPTYVGGLAQSSVSFIAAALVAGTRSRQQREYLAQLTSMNMKSVSNRLQYMAK
jgi:hypothetical protein